MSIVGTQVFSSTFTDNDVPMCRVEALDGFDFVGVLAPRQSSAMDSDSTDRAGVAFCWATCNFHLSLAEAISGALISKGKNVATTSWRIIFVLFLQF